MILSANLKYLLFGFCLFTFSFSLKADHYLGASISYKSLGGFTYEYTVIAFTATDHPQSDKDMLTVFCGDGNSVVLPRVNGSGTKVNTAILKSIYKGQYTYTSEGNFQVFISENFRQGSILNINAGNSAFTNIYLAAIVPVYASLSVCVNNSAEYQLTPIFYAYQGVEYSTSFGLYDADGDSLSYELINCRGVNGLAVENYFIPTGVSVNSLTGILTWTNPLKGRYAFSVKVNEFRKGKKIGESSIDFVLYVSTEFTTAPIFSLDPQFVAGQHTINPADVLKYGSSISLAGTHTITYSTWNNTGASVSSNPVLSSSSVSDTLEWTTLLSDGRAAPYTFVHRFSITEGGKQYQKDFAALVYVTGNQVVTCTVPDISNVEKVPPELFDYTVSPTAFIDGVYVNTGSSPATFKIFIYDVQGKEMEAFSNFTQQTLFLDLSHLSSAVYLMVMWKADKKFVTRIVKL